MDYLKIDLIDRYSNELAFIGLNETINAWVDKNNILQNHQNSPYKVGDLITFFGGYHNDIIYTTKVVGFTEEGHLYVYWDCY